MLTLIASLSRINTARSDLRVSGKSLLLLVCLFLSACGGGISGSGSGGSTSSLPRPNTVDIYELASALREGELPDGLPAVEEDWFDISNPYLTIQSGFAQIVSNISTSTLALLYYQAVLPSVTTFCQTQLTQECSADDAGISVEYTADLAQQEIDIRTRLEIRDDLPSEEAALLLTAIQDSANEKIGTQIRVDRLTFSSTVLEQRVEMLVGGSLPALYTVHFSAPSALSNSLLTARAIGDDVYSQQLTFRYEDAASESDPVEVVLALESGSLSSGYTVTYHSLQIADTDNSYFQADVSFTDRGQTDTLSGRGQVSGTAAYAVTRTVEDLGGAETQLHVRQSYSESTEGLSTCAPAQSIDGCNSEQDWQVQSGENPITSPLYLSNDEMDELAEQLQLQP